MMFKNDSMAEKKMFEDLEKEIFFMDPKDEYNYFIERIEKIKTYPNDFFKKSARKDLIKRYIRGLASLKEIEETSAFRGVYTDCLIQLGIDDYCIEQEVNNYKLTHSSDAQEIFVSKKLIKKR